MQHTTISHPGEMKAKAAAIGLGVIFIVIWLLSFIPNPLVGANALFLTNGAHDAVHLLSGLVLLIAAFISERAALRTIQAIGIVYWLVTLLGLFVGNGMLLWFIEINTWDNLLHAIIAAVTLYLGFGALNKR